MISEDRFTVCDAEGCYAETNADVSADRVFSFYPHINHSVFCFKAVREEKSYFFTGTKRSACREMVDDYYSYFFIINTNIEMLKPQNSQSPR